jgi:predicted dehydrogenase
MTVHRVGIVGAGAVARQIHLPVLSSMDNVRVAWLGDVNVRRAAAVARAHGVPCLDAPPSADNLPECDVVLLAIPVLQRTRYYEALARREVAVFAEKPLAVSGGEHARVVGLFAPHRLACGYMRRLYAASGLLRRAVHEQWFGPLQRLRIREGARGTRTGVDVSHYDDLGAAGGGVLLTQGCHTLDLVLYVTGASGFHIRSRQLEWDGEIDRRAEAVFVVRDVGGRPNEVCAVEYCVSWLDDQDNCIELGFAAVTLSAELGPGAAVMLQPRPGRSMPPVELRPGNGAATSNQAFFLEWDHFLRGLENDEPSVMAAATAQGTAALLDALYGRGGEAV